MKYWEKHRSEPATISLPDNGGGCNGSVIIEAEPDGNIRFIDGCDEYFATTLSPTEAIEALQEAIDWIKRQQEDRK